MLIVSHTWRFAAKGVSRDDDHFALSAGKRLGRYEGARRSRR